MAWTIEQRRAYKRQWNKENRGRYAEKEKVWREANQDRLWRARVKRQLRQLYGIDPEDYDRMLHEQEGRCAICKRHQTEFKRRLHVDHNHLTGNIRRLLCGGCNSGLGLFQDSPELLEAAAHYLRENGG